MKIPGPVPILAPYPFSPIRKLARPRLAPLTRVAQAIRTRLAPLARGEAGLTWQPRFALDCLDMPPKSKVESAAARKAGAAKMAKAFGTTSRLKITCTPNQFHTYMGRELGVPGAFWGIASGKVDMTMEDENVVYPMRVIRCSMGNN